MKTIVITGGTDGIGRALAQTYLGRGDQVVIVGTSHAKGEAFLAASRGQGAESRASFIQARLELIDENTRLIDQLAARFGKLDMLVLGARYHRSTRVETADGLEFNFALVYLSRFLLSHGLVGPLRRAGNAVVLNFADAGSFGPPQWDDLQQAKQYHGMTAMVQAGILNGLLAVDFADRYSGTNIRYVNNFPGPVVTSFAGEYDHDPATARQVASLRSTGKPVDAAVRDIVPFIDSAAHGPLTAVNQGTAVPTAGPGTPSLKDARRLYDYTRDLIDSRSLRRDAR